LKPGVGRDRNNEAVYNLAKFMVSFQSAGIKIFVGMWIFVFGPCRENQIAYEVPHSVVKTLVKVIYCSFRAKSEITRSCKMLSSVEEHC
jgi:hypothetical protein